MELDSKQKVLLAIYTEYQKDFPDMSNITFRNLGLENDVFKMAVEELVNEVMITDVTVQHRRSSPIPVRVNLKHCKLTPYGIAYVEQKADLDKTASREQKVKRIMKKTKKWGWEQFKDFGAKVIAEMLQKSIEKPK